jgi:hypothetical protein
LTLVKYFGEKGQSCCSNFTMLQVHKHVIPHPIRKRERRHLFFGHMQTKLNYTHRQSLIKRSRAVNWSRLLKRDGLFLFFQKKKLKFFGRSFFQTERIIHLTLNRTERNIIKMKITWDKCSLLLYTTTEWSILSMFVAFRKSIDP